MALNFRRSALVRVAPFAVFMAVLAWRGLAPADGGWGLDARWLYALQACGAAVLLSLWLGARCEQSRPAVAPVPLAILVLGGALALAARTDALLA